MQNFSPSYSSSEPLRSQKKVRGAFFSFLLFVKTLLSVFATFVIVMGGARVDHFVGADPTMQGVHHVVSRAILGLAIFQIAQIACLFGMWAWKKWAVTGYFMVTLFVNLAAYKLAGDVSYLSLTLDGVLLLCVWPCLSMFD